MDSITLVSGRGQLKIFTHSWWSVSKVSQMSTRVAWSAVRICSRLYSRGPTHNNWNCNLCSYFGVAAGHLSVATWSPLNDAKGTSRHNIPFVQDSQHRTIIYASISQEADGTRQHAEQEWSWMLNQCLSTSITLLLSNCALNGHLLVSVRCLWTCWL